MPRALQSPAELWLKMDENPLVHEKAACSHTLTAPSPLHIYPEPVLPNSGRFCSYSEAHSYFLCLNKGRRLNLHPGVITNLPFGRARKGSTLILPAEGWKPWHQRWKPQEPKKHFQDFIRLNRDIRVRFLSITSSKKWLVCQLMGVLMAHSSGSATNEATATAFPYNHSWAIRLLPAFNGWAGKPGKKAKGSSGGRGSFTSVRLGQASVALLFLNCIMKHF